MSVREYLPVVFTLALLFWFGWGFASERLVLPAVRYSSETPVQPKNFGTLLFVGDIMLARRVETLMDERGPQYPFEGVMELTNGVDVAIANFEGIVPIEHIKTPDFTYQFSVRAEYFDALRIAGFDVLSLANNHTLDFGQSALAHTRSLCRAQQLICGGDPHNNSAFLIERVNVGDAVIGIIFLNDLFRSIDTDAMAAHVRDLTSDTDAQFAFIHWGTEYEGRTPTQARIAHALIEGGIDAVFGHHPHIVQDIELYQGKPIFYSLGNFIFDQYFNSEVQQGLAVRVVIAADSIEYELVPVESLETRSSPRVITGAARDAVINRLLASVSERPDAVADGVIRVVREDDLHVQ